MFGIFLASLSSAFTELSDSIGKKQTNERVYSHYTFGFLSVFGGVLFMVLIGFIRDDFLFSLSSLPTFLPRVLLEVLQAHVTIEAIIRADRGDFGPIRLLTIPLLLVADMVLGYSVGTGQLLGMGIISGTIVALLASERFQTKGLWLLMFIAVNAAVTLSLYKYDITHFNSVSSEQSIIGLVQLLYFFVFAAVRANENPFQLLGKRTFFIQTVSAGAGGVFGSYAYLFAPASIVTVALRAFGVLFSIISGRLYFRERGFFVKLASFCAIVAGLVLLT